LVLNLARRDGGGTTFDDLLRAVPGAVDQVLVAAHGDTVITSVALVDVDDLRDTDRTGAVSADLLLQVGVSATEALAWFQRLSEVPVELRPVAVLSKAALGSAPLQQAAQAAGVALVAVPPQTRWESLLTAIQGVLDPTPQWIAGAVGPRGLPGGDTDLYGVAQTVAELTGGLVTIEDERSHVLAYSASDEAADELRRLSILGRVGPAAYLDRLRDSGVYDRLQRSDEVIEVPPDAGLDLKRRLVVSILALAQQDAPRARPSGRQLLGTIWVQEGQERLAADSAAVLRGAAAIAARLITRAINAPSNEAVQIQRLLGARGGGVDVGSLATALSIPTSGPAVVIGFGTVDRTLTGATAALSPALRLHASAFARESLVTTIAERVYVLFPRTPSLQAVTSWTGGVIERLAFRGAPALRAAVAAPVGSLSDVAAARTEVDRVLDGTTGDQRVTTLADSRTPVLLGEILDLVAAHPALRDPRIAALLDYDSRYSATMQVSVEAYLRHFGDVREAAGQLQVHPNTLRYRLKRAEQILDIDLSEPAGRLLVEIQLGALRRSAG